MKATATDLFSNPDRFCDLDDWRAEALALHAKGPVHRVEVEGFDPFWAVIGHDQVMSVERRPTQFTNNPRPILVSRDEAIEQDARGTLIRTLINMDAPDHAKFRRLTADWFKPSSLGRLAERLDHLSEQAVTRLQDRGGNADFYREVARSYPLQVILDILGLPEGDYPLVFRLTQELFGDKDPDLARNTDPNSNYEALNEFIQYFQALIADRRDHSRDDLASLIANATVDGSPMAFIDQVGYYVIIATAGHDTTAAAMSGGLRALAEHPDQLARLRAEPELMPNAVEEMIRWTAPVRHFQRTSQGNNMIGDVRIEDGAPVYLSYLAANLDPLVFDDPLRFDVTRANAGSNIAFGYGVHFCLGAQLARMELRSLFSTLVPRLEHLELAGDAPMYRSTFVGGQKAVPIRYTLSPA